jgi:hypothetical protein
MKFLKENLDLYWQPINFFYKKDSNHKSICGGITSLIIIIISLGYLAFLLWDMIVRSLPTIYTVSNVHPKPQSITIQYNQMTTSESLIPVDIETSIISWPISVAIRKTQGGISSLVLIDESYVKIQVQEIFFKNSIKISRSLKYELCDDPSLFNSREAFYELNMYMTYCIKDSYLIQGFQGAENSSWLQVTFSICKGQTYCKSPSQIQSYLQGLQFELYYIGSEIDLHKKNDTYVQKEITQEYWDAHPQFTKYARTHLSIDIIKNYMNYIPDYLSFTYSIEYILSLKNIETQFTDYDDENGNLLILLIFPSDVQINLEKSSTDIFYQISLFGGLFPLLFLIGYLFVSRTAKYKLKESLINDFYKVIPSQTNKIRFMEFLASNYLEYSNKILPNIFKSDTKIEIQEGEKLKQNDIIINNYRRKETCTEELLDEDFNNKNSKIINENQRKDRDEKDDFKELKNFFNIPMIDTLIDLDNKEYIKKDSVSLKKEEKLVQKRLAEDFDNRKKKYLFHLSERVFSILLDSYQKGLRFVSYQVFLKDCCRCCFKTNLKKQNLLAKNFEVFEYAEKRLAREFDLIHVLDTMKKFKSFIKVYFNETQISLFSYVQKPVLKHTDHNKEHESEATIQDFYESVHSLLSKESYDYKLMDNMLLINLGINQKDINTMRMELADKKYFDKDHDYKNKKQNNNAKENESQPEGMANQSIELAIRQFGQDQLNKYEKK